jgi:DNA polymerase-1
MRIINSAEIPPGLRNDESLWIYNGLDCMVTHQLHDVLGAQPDPGTTELVYQFEKGLLAPALTAMRRGLRVDEDMREQLRVDLKARHRRLSGMEKNAKNAWQVVDNHAPLQLLAHAVWHKPLNPNSPKQMKELLYEYYQLPYQYKSAKGKRTVSTDRNALEGLTLTYIRSRPLLYMILKLRDLEKMLSVVNAPVGPDGRMRFSFNIAGTETGRWSSSKHIFDQGMNFQNITKELRAMFIPDEGHVFVYPDLEQAESRGVAYLSGDQAYIDACEGGDLHTTVCRMVWPDLPWTGDLAQDKELCSKTQYYRQYSYRDMAKRGGHGTNYYGQAKSMARNLKVDEKVMHRFMAMYYGGTIYTKSLKTWGYEDMLDFEGVEVEGKLARVAGAFPGIQRWHDEIRTELQETGMLTTPLGRRRQFWGRLKDDATLREAIAFVPQSLIGDILNIGVFRFWKALDPGHAMFMGQVHDAILGQVKEDALDKVMPLIQEAMTVPVNINGRTMVIPIEHSAGKNWRDCKSWP